MDFCKMNGAGNDFLIINNMSGKFGMEEWPKIAKTLCERHLSIGADGIMVVEKSDGEEADYKMLFFNADGSMGEMCGNGARCICRYGYEMGLAGEIQKIETTAGLVTGKRIDQRNYQIRLNNPSVLELDYPVEIDGVTYDCAYVELGNPGIPHAAVPIKGLREYPETELFELGRKLRYSPDFPKGANINFYEVIGENKVYERTYERGVEDFTYACGTGTGSVVTALTLKGQTSGECVHAFMKGGELIIDIQRQGDEIKSIYLTGPTNMVAKGTVLDEELK